MKKQQIFVRGKNKDGHFDHIDVLDLDETSFRAFIVEKLFQHGLLVGVKPELLKTEDIQMQEKKGEGVKKNGRKQPNTGK